MNRRAEAIGWLTTLVGITVLCGMPLPAFSAPVGCDSRVTVTPASIPAGTRGARVRVASSLADVHLHASSGSVGGPVSEGPLAVVAEYEAGPEAGSSAIVAAVGGNVCGFAVVHITGAADAPRGAAGGSTLLAVHPQSFPADVEGDVAVYVPYSYQIGGFTLIVPRERVQPLAMRLEDAMRFVVTAGARVVASEIPPVPSLSAPK